MNVDVRLINRTIKKSKKHLKLVKMLTEDVNKNALTLHRDMSALVWTDTNSILMVIAVTISMNVRLIHFLVQEKFES